MFRFRVTEIVKFRDSSAINLKIKKRCSTKSKVTKANLNLTTTETIEAKETPFVQDTSDCTLSNNSVGCTVHNQAQRNKSELKKKRSSTLLSKSTENKMNAGNKFKIMKDLKSYSVFGGEVTENCGIQCIEDGRCLKIPSVTYILNETMSVKTKKALEMWKNNIIDTFDEKYFRLLCKGLLEEGKVFHKCIQNVLLKKVVPLEPRIKPVYYSVEPVLKDLQRVHSFETYVTHPTLRYSGIVDCIVSYRKQLYIIDWKRSAAQGASLAATFDAPVQLAAYIGAVNASNKHPFRIDRGLVIVAYTSGEPASVHELNDSTLQKAWEEWLRRLELFYTNLNKATN